MIIDLKNGNLVDSKDISAVVKEEVKSDSDFKYHPKTFVILKTGEKVESGCDEEFLKPLIEGKLESGMLGDVDFVDSKDDEEICTKEEEDDYVFKGDISEDLLKTLKNISEELSAIREFFQRFVMLVEDGNINIKMK